MTASVAEAYMLILRPVPILGEAWAIPFNGQIYIDDWKWSLTPATGQRTQESSSPSQSERTPPDRTGDPAEPNRPQLARAEPPPPFDGDVLIDAVRRMQTNRQYTQIQRDRRVQRLIEQAAAEHARAQQTATRQQEAGAAATPGAGAGENNEGTLTFSFSKNTDLATSQMLYTMANNDLIPTIILTLFHRSSTSPVTLIITMINCRLTSCTLSCDGEETMSDITEQWTAQYEHISYVYQNRPPAGIPTSPFVAATQGRVKTFVMAPRGIGGGVF
jgi:type VI protein secretion system component Hcp